MRDNATEHWRAGWFVVCVTLLLAGCGSSTYRPTRIVDVGFTARAVSQTSGDITVRAALPDAAETKAVTGLDLYEQGIQPVWLEVHNGSSEGIRAALWSIDRDYFSPLEVAYTNKRAYRGDAFRALERRLYETGMPRRIAPGQTRSGFVYTRLTPGTKGFNLDLFSTAEAHNFTFFLDLPGFTPDYRSVDLAAIYGDDEIRDVALREGLQILRDGVPCCATDASGTEPGRPLNVVLWATPKALRRSLMRGEWRETSVEERAALVEERDHFRGRPADGRFYLRREDDDVELVLNIWLTRWRVEGTPIWIAQAYYREIDQPLMAALRRSGALERSELLTRFVGESISADVDSAQRFVVQNLWYNQSVRRAAVMPIMEARDVDSPGQTHDGLGYVTAGTRVVVELSETPTAFADVRLVSLPSRDAELSGTTP